MLAQAQWQQHQPQSGQPTEVIDEPGGNEEEVELIPSQGQDVISSGTPGFIVSKASKGWVIKRGAMVEMIVLEWRLPGLATTAAVSMTGRLLTIMFDVGGGSTPNM